jgi:hypothetical protein
MIESSSCEGLSERGIVEDIFVHETDVLTNPTYDEEGLPDLEEDLVVEEDSSLFLQEVSHDIFSPRI